MPRRVLLVGLLALLAIAPPLAGATAADVVQDDGMDGEGDMSGEDEVEDDSMDDGMDGEDDSLLTLPVIGLLVAGVALVGGVGYAFHAG